MKNSNMNGNKTLNSWRLISIIGDLLGVFGVGAFANVIYRGIVLNNLDITGNDIGYLIIHILLVLVIIVDLIKNAILNKKGKYNNKKLDLENADVVNIYEDLKTEVSKDLKKEQSKTKLAITLKQILFYIAIYGVAYLIVLFNANTFWVDKSFLPMIFIVISFIALICSWISLVDMKNRKVQVYTKKYRENVVLPILKRIDNNFKFIFDIDELDGEINSKVVKQKFEESNLATEPYNRFFVDDVICNEVDNFNVYEIDVAKRVRVNGGSAYMSYFKGLFLEIDSTRNVDEKIKIGSRDIKNYSHDFTVNVSNEDFNKAFYIMSENDKLAKEIIDEDMQRKLVKLYEEYDVPFELSFVGNKVYARLLTGEMFEPRFNGNPVNKTSVANGYFSLELIKKIKDLVK